MNLVKVDGTPFTVTCVKCGRKAMSDKVNYYADIDGKPYKDYYCPTCAAKECIKRFV